MRKETSASPVPGGREETSPRLPLGREGAGWGARVGLPWVLRLWGGLAVLQVLSREPPAWVRVLASPVLTLTLGT